MRRSPRCGSSADARLTCCRPGPSRASPRSRPGTDLVAVIADAAAGALAGRRHPRGHVEDRLEGRGPHRSRRTTARTRSPPRPCASSRPARPPSGGTTRIVENRLGIVSAAAGVDASNTPRGHRAAAAGGSGCLGPRARGGPARRGSASRSASSSRTRSAARGARVRPTARSAPAACTSSRTCAARRMPRAGRSSSPCRASRTSSPPPPTS